MSQIPDSLSTSEEEYRNIFEAASDGLIVYDLEINLVVEANPATCEMHGYTRQEFIGLNPEVFILSESRILFKEHVRTVEPGGVFEALAIHTHKDGSPFPVEVRRSAINYRGRPCLLSVISNVSQRIQTKKIPDMQADTRQQAALSAGADAFISKGETPDRVAERLRLAAASVRDV